ncbi:MAG: integrase core domain-containing protein, partial [Roseomonas sp.]|nr:integrase core domain-containing protein [Roseomonas sp.]
MPVSQLGDVRVRPVAHEVAEEAEKQAKFWGISPSYAFGAEPETNGVIERFFRTLKEQAIHGRVFQTIDEVRDAVRNFAAR